MFNEFTGDTLDEVLLADSPLEAVFAQVTFPVQLSFDQEDVAAQFQVALSDQYPILRKQQSVTFKIEGSEPTSVTSQYWRFHAADHRRHVSLGTTFLAFDCADYVDRSRFVGDFVELLKLMIEIGGPTFIDRLGVRYVNRISGDDADPDSLVRWIDRSTLGPLSLVSSESRWALDTTQSHAALSREDRRIQARWGLCDADQPFAPGIRPHLERSWVLDIDCFSDTPQALELESIQSELEEHCKVAYSFFRWAMTDDFIAVRS